MSLRKSFIAIGTTFVIACSAQKNNVDLPESISGIYPHLAYYNNEGECGTGAVVPWANRLWVITYGPHLPFGSSDKLYEVTPDLLQITRNESIGGTPANRMVHQESNQLFIGPYAIDSARNVRVIPYTGMPGRHTGNARHLTDPANKIYYGTMEEGFYEVDVHSLAVTQLYKDGNNAEGRQVNHDDTGVNPENATLPGAHGKGLYSGQGVMVFSNNGEASQEALKKFDIEAGILAEWNGKDWKVVRRNQFVEVTGPGGIYGNTHPATDPIWATGWDYKSVLLGVRDPDKGWSFYRIPKASHSYDGAHGWNTEWPRIRDVGTEDNPDYLMTMHGMFWHFPGTFTAENSAGIRPRSSYLKVIGDFARWDNRLVFGCDDSAQNEFLNVRTVKGNIPGPGQSNSNLWFTSLNTPDELGPTNADGAIWSNEDVKANIYSDPFLFAGWLYRCCWIKNEGPAPVEFTFEVDVDGKRSWRKLKSVTVDSKKDLFVPFLNDEIGEWIRVKTNKDTKTTVCFNYSSMDSRNNRPDSIFHGLSRVDNKESTIGGLLYPLGHNRRALGLLANHRVSDIETEGSYYEMKDKFELVPKIDTMSNFISEKLKIPQRLITIDSCSILILDDQNRRWRLPLGNEGYTEKTDKGLLRVCREVATERDLFHAMGTFYELPAENADGFAKIRPISTHDYQINDYASYRGMLILTGIESNYNGHNSHIIMSNDKKAAIWVGVIDDLWKLGKPRGEGGPWKNSLTKANVPSDPYLIGFYDKKTLNLSHNNNQQVQFTIEIDPTGNGDWMVFKTLRVGVGQTVTYVFPESFQARWIRFTTNHNTRVTAWLKYE